MYRYCMVAHTQTALQHSTASSPPDSLIFITWKGFTDVILFSCDVLWSFSHMPFPPFVLLIVFLLQDNFSSLQELCARDRTISACLCLCLRISACKNHGSCHGSCAHTDRRWKMSLRKNKPEGEKWMVEIAKEYKWWERLIHSYFWSAWLPRRHSLAAAVGWLTVECVNACILVYSALFVGLCYTCIIPGVRFILYDTALLCLVF